MIRPVEEKVVSMPARPKLTLDPIDIARMELESRRLQEQQAAAKTVGEYSSEVLRYRNERLERELRDCKKDLSYQKELNMAQHRSMALCFALTGAMALFLIIAGGVIIHLNQQLQRLQPRQIRPSSAPTKPAQYTSQVPSLAHARTPAPPARPAWDGKE